PPSPVRFYIRDADPRGRRRAEGRGLHPSGPGGGGARGGGGGRRRRRPRRDGFSVLKTLRERHVQTPVLLLTARDAVADKVAGLDLGADDYLTKPFAFEEF